MKNNVVYIESLFNLTPDSIHKLLYAYSNQDSDTLYT